MSNPTASSLRLLVALANYGTANDKYLRELIDEYRSMPYSIDIVVHSNVPKDLGQDIEVIVGLPSKDPFTLPFAHKQLFVDRANDYDVFVYSEDDMLLTKANIEAFIRASEVLRADEVAGFLRFEKDTEGELSYPDVHWNYHWKPDSVRSRDGYAFAFFTNEHAACYMLTRAQLCRAIKSGGFLVAPHQGEYELREAAATDPYTQCGFTKLICISHFSDFLVHHLPNKYIGKLGLEARYFECQIQALQRIAVERAEAFTLLGTDSELKASHFDKDYYEPVRQDLVSLVPAGAGSVLSLGCGWGATEEILLGNGKRVVAVALDSVISACAQARGVETVQGHMDEVLSRLAGQHFDCLLISNLLHLLANPAGVLAAVRSVLSAEATVIIAVPNLQRGPVLWKKLTGVESHKFLGNFEKSGVQPTSRTIVRTWLKQAGMRVDRFVDVVPKGTKSMSRGALRFLLPLLSSEIIAVGAAKG